MGLIGDCEDCGEPAQLQYKPAVPIENQSRPSVCPRCKDEREYRAGMHERDMRHGEDIPPERY